MLHVGKIEEIIKESVPKLKIPAAVAISKTDKAEQIEMEREIDVFKRRENPDFKGAFHEKKRTPQAKKDKRRRR